MYRVNVGFVSQLGNMLEGEGLDSARLCREAGIDMSLLGQPDSFVLEVDLFRLMELAERESGNPDIGLRAYQHFLPGGFQLVGYTMMSSPNLKQALESLVRFYPLLGNGYRIGLAQEDGGQRLWGVAYSEDRPKPRSFEDAGIASVLGFCRWLTGGSLPPLQEVEFTYPEPQDTDEHRRLFDCALRFGAPRNSVLFDQQALLHPLSSPNEALALLHGLLAEHQIDKLQGSSYHDRVRSLLIERLSLGVCDMGAVALSLGVSKRTLQRGLVREGVPFKEVLDGARRQLADHYLRHHSYSLTKVGELLGFKEPSSFQKACQRWFSMPPGRYRGHLSGECQSVPK